MRTSFHQQPEAQHPKSSAIHKLPADYPIFRANQTLSRHRRMTGSDPLQTLGRGVWAEGNPYLISGDSLIVYEKPR
jgi:hypothetical protein